MKYPVIAILCAASAASGYFIGNRDPGPDNSPASTESTTAHTGETPARLASSTPPVGEPNISSTTEDEFKERLASFEEADASAILSLIQRTDDAKKRRGHLIDYFRRLGELDPEGAIDATKDFTGTDRMSFLTAAIAGWARADPDAAWDRFLFESKDGMLNSMNPWAVVSEIAKTDIYGAIEKIQQLKGTRATQQGLMALIQLAKEQHNFAETADAFTALEDTKIKDEATSRLFRLWSNQDSDAALNSIQQIEEPDLRKAAMDGFIRGWAQKDAIGALDFVVENFDDPSAFDSAKVVGQSLLRSMTGDELLDTIASIQNPKAQEQVVSGILRDLVALDPQITMSFVERIPDEGKKRNETRNVLRQWLEFDAPAAAQYAANIEDDRLKARTISAFLDRNSIESDIDETTGGGSRYLQLASTIRDDNQRQGALFNYAHNISRARKNGQTELADKMLAELQRTNLLTEQNMVPILSLANKPLD